MTTSSNSNLTTLIGVERLRRVRAWLFGLGLVIILFSGTLLNASGANPILSSSIYAVLKDHGFLLWLVLPSLGIGVLLLTASAAATFYLRKKDKSVL